MIKQFKNLIIDMDGVLWRGQTAVPALNEFIDTLRDLDIQITFATNNASRTPDQYVEKFAGFGVTIDKEQVMSSALATAYYLTNEYTPAETNIYLIGREGLRTALREQGFNVLSPYDTTTPADVVTVGFNWEVTYDDFKAATIHIRQHGAAFVGTNPDATYPTEQGLVPGNGSLIALLKAAADVEPLIIGKPYPTMFEVCLRKLGDGATAENTAMIGDRLSTDIAGGKNAGIGTILVLTGVSTRDDLEKSDLQPDYVYDDIDALGRALKEAYGR